MNLQKKISFLSLLLILSFSALQAQTRISSPYSRYGIGDVSSDKYLKNISMGGTSYGYRNTTSVNYSNPASYIVFDSTSFVVETGIRSNFTQLRTATQNQNSMYSSLGYLVFGFPVTKWWGSSIGLLPYSNVGYKIADREYLAGIGNIDYLYEGSGGLNKFYWGNAFKISGNLSFGLNASYIFGSLDKIRTVSQPDSSFFFRVRLKNGLVVNDFLFNYGLQYSKKYNNDMFLNAGLIFSTNTPLNAKQDSFATTFISADSGTEYTKDTIVNTQGDKGTIVIPQNIGFGLCFGKKDRWSAGIDMSMQNWSKFKSFGEKDSLKNSFQVSAGCEFIPENTALSSYLKKIHYRIGARYNQTYLQLRNNQIKEYAVSLGFGLPLRKSKTSVNIGFELGQRGTTEQNLIKENFGNIILSFSIYERWFLRKKFD